MKNQIMLNTPKLATVGFARRLLSAMILLALFGQVAPSMAAPSQVPLLNRPENKPKPNFMLTLDDSGSMTYQYLPERTFPYVLSRNTDGSKNTVEVKFPNDGKVFLHPEEISKNIFTFNGRLTGEEGGTDTNFVTATLNDSEFDDETKKIYQLQMRSPQVNRIYYDPSSLYLPWTRPDGTRFPGDVSPTAANLDPMALDPLNSSTANNKTVNLKAGGEKISARWYCGIKAGGGAGFNYQECFTQNKTFNPAIYYILAPGANPNSATVGDNNYKLYNLNDGSTDNIRYNSIYQNRTDCTVEGTQTSCTRIAEWKNFVNWFVYYRSRLFIAQAVIPEAFSSIGDNIRLGWGTIHQGITFDINKTPSDTLSQTTYSVDGATSKIVQQGVRDLNTEQKNKLTDWMRKLKTYPYTPSKDAMYEVGQYFSRTDNQSPWATDMVNGTPLASQLGCRRSYNIMITDGYYQRASVNTLPNTDSTSVNASSSSSNKYEPIYPFKDEASNTMADFAMEFWAHDLQPILPDKVKAVVESSANSTPTALDLQISEIKSDPATWQHLGQFIVGFGVTGTLERTDTTLEKLINCGQAGGLCWSNTPNEIDDLWHAAINSRGQYFDVNSPDELKASLQEAVGKGAGPKLKEAGLATAAPTLISGNKKFVPEYNAGDWTGDISAYMLDINGKSGARVWLASAMRPEPDNRNIVVWDTAPGSTATASEFRYNSLSARTKTLLGSSSSEKLVNYLRGTEFAGLRTRKGKLPDFINSTPLFVKSGVDLGYAKLPAEQGGGSLYQKAQGATGDASYLDEKAARTNGVLFIGGNGGMLHAFDASTGVEKFAFIPEGGVSKLSRLSQPSYGHDGDVHQYFVDGPLLESDVYASLIANNVSAQASWQNIVVGTMGAGGKSIFALRLNKSDPTNLTSNNVLWETTADKSTDLGYITSDPQVGVLPNGKWKVFVGNGVDSASGRAALLLLDVNTGDIESIPATPESIDSRNGLGGVRLVKNSAGQVIAAYAGDLMGNLWRFEYREGSMNVGYGGKAVFRAFDASGKAQPITAAPLVATRGNDVGQVVIFGTGRLLYETDSSDISPQTIYGVLDKVGIDQSTATALNIFSLTSADRASLVQQTINSVSAVTQKDASNATTGVTNIFELSGYSLDWAQQNGWLLDLNVPTSASATAKVFPKVIYPIQAFGKSVLVSSVKPGSNVESCEGTTGTGYAFFIDALTGSKSLDIILDADGNGSLDAADGLKSGYEYEGGRQTIVTKEKEVDPTKRECDKASFLSANEDRVAGIPCSRQIIKDRIWRQLLNPPTR